MRHEDDHHHDVETEPNKVFQILVISHENTCDKHEADIAIFRHAERQRDEPTWRTILLNIFDTKLEEVDAHERWHHQSRDGAIQLTNHQFASNRQNVHSSHRWPGNRSLRHILLFIIVRVSQYPERSWALD